MDFVELNTILQPSSNVLASLPVFSINTTNNNNNMNALAQSPNNIYTNNSHQITIIPLTTVVNQQCAPAYNIISIRNQPQQTQQIQPQQIPQIQPQVNNNGAQIISSSSSDNVKKAFLANKSQKPPPLHKTQYKENKDGTFQCLITNKETGQICNKIFAHRSSIKRHKNVFHDNYKPFQCVICSLTFARKHLLKIHTRVHTKEKPYKCSEAQCNKAFTQKAHLNEHKRIHTGERPYVCSFCGAQFRQKSVMDAHKRTHTGEKPFQCQLCGKDFRHYTSFWRHKKDKICIKRNRFVTD